MADPAPAPAPVSAKAAAIGIGTILVGMAAQVIPPKYVLFATSISGCCAWIAAAWRPTNRWLGYIWIVIDVVGMNVGFARNAPPLPLPPSDKLPD